MMINAMELEQPALLDSDMLESTAAKRSREAIQESVVTGRKLVLASVGAGAYVLDGVLSVYRGGVHLLQSAEQRGEQMEHATRQRFSNLEEQAIHEMRKLQGQAEETLEHVGIAGGSVNEEVEKRVELTLANMGLPSRERLERLSQEIDALNRKLDEQIMRLPSEPMPDPLR